MNILVTGATGFIGSRLINSIQHKYSVRAALWRQEEVKNLSRYVQHTVVGDICLGTDWSTALRDIDVVVHLAARVHIMDDNSQDLLIEYRKVNTDATANLAMQAVSAGVKRIVFVSTVKVNGESATADRPFTPDDKPNPVDPYGISKWEAECRLREISNRTGLDVVIVRPVIVYGPGVRANILAFIKLADRALPLLYKGIRNSRSFLALDNLVSFLDRCIDHPNASRETFLLSDGQDLSISTLHSLIAESLNRPDRQFYLPKKLLKGGLGILGMNNVYSRLIGSLVVDSSKARNLLDWTPPTSIRDGLKMTSDWYLSQKVIAINDHSL